MAEAVYRVPPRGQRSKAPDGTRRLNAEVARIIARPDVKQTLTLMGIDAFTSTPEDLGDYVKSEMQKWARLVKDAGIQPE